MEKTKNNKFFKIDQLEQYGKWLNLEFGGIPQQNNENVTDIVIEISKKLDIAVNPNDISIAHKLPTKKQNRHANETQNRQVTETPQHNTIIVQFTNKRIRNAIYANRRKAYLITQFPVPMMRKLFVNKNLTSFRKRLFWSTKQAAKTKRITNTTGPQTDKFMLERMKAVKQ